MSQTSRVADFDTHMLGQRPRVVGVEDIFVRRLQIAGDAGESGESAGDERGRVGERSAGCRGQRRQGRGRPVIALGWC